MSIKRNVIGAALAVLIGVLFVAGASGGEQPPIEKEVTVEFGEISPIMPEQLAELVG